MNIVIGKRMAVFLLAVSVVGVTLGIIATNAAVAQQSGATGGLVEKVESGSIQKGMCVPYFGEELPKGYVWADGTTEWPANANWVPQHLRHVNNNKVPNLDNLPMVGTNSLELVGTDAVVTPIAGTGTIDPQNLKIEMKGNDGWSVNCGREGAWLWIGRPAGNQPVEVADKGGKVGNAYVQRFLIPSSEQKVSGTATATFSANLARGNVPGVRVRWIIYVGTH